jgi:YD repeat-containing protein
VGDTSSTNFPVTAGAIQSTNHGGRDAFVAKISPPTSQRTVSYQYDGLGRLTGATETPGSSFAYTYDLSGNRTSVSVNGTQQSSYTYDAADQVQGWTYDGAGNLTSDGATTYTYDALGRLTATSATGQSRAYAYNGDGTLVSATINGTTTSYAQDLAADTSQILAKLSGSTSVDYLYGSERLAALTGGVRSWYGWDGQGSARQALSDTGNVTGDQSYDPFGQPEGGTRARPGPYTPI